MARSSGVAKTQVGRRKHVANVEPPAQSLNERGILRGTSKSSLGHGYLRHYERLFQHLWNEPINILEIGVAGGEALRLWAECFPRAVVVGTDSRPEARWHAGERLIIEVGAQDDGPFLEKLGNLYRPTIVIDNGSHRADDIMLAFKKLYPTMRHGGYYIVECLHFHSGGGAAHHRGQAVLSPQDYFLELARMVACPDGDQTFDRTLRAMTDSVEFIYGGVAIRRKQPTLSLAESLATHRAIVERANHPLMWSNYARLVLGNLGDPWEAVLACLKAIELDAGDHSLHFGLSEALERAGDLPAAIIACHQAIKLHPTFEVYKRQLSSLELKYAATPAVRPAEVG